MPISPEIAARARAAVGIQRLLNAAAPSRREGNPIKSIPDIHGRSSEVPGPNTPAPGACGGTGGHTGQC